jgi:pilus assembly protein CpaF
MGFDRLVATCADPGAALLETLALRSAAPLLFASGTGARQALGRLVAQSCAARPGLLPSVAREWLAGCFDLIIEVARLRDGRLRVLRIAELCGVEGDQIVLRDLFHAVSERGSSGDSHLTPTGTPPQLLEELRHRGFPVDPTIFERTSGR